VRSKAGKSGGHMEETDCFHVHIAVLLRMNQPGTVESFKKVKIFSGGWGARTACPTVREVFRRSTRGQAVRAPNAIRRILERTVPARLVLL
jgi:hypothetical protein